MAKTAVVTGGTRGIGEAISKALKAAGYKVAATYAGNDEAANKFKADTGIPVFKFDVSDCDACAAGIAQIEKEVGPVDILATDAAGTSVAVELKRRGDIDGVEQLTRYLELMNRDPRLAPVKGVFAAQEIKPQARTLAEDRGIRCVVLDYDAMRGIESGHARLF